MADGAASSSPLQFAASRFDNISPAEQKLLEAAANGKDADCTSLSEKDRIIRGELLSWLCTDPDVSVQVTYRGVSIRGGKIVNKTDLEWARISFPIMAVKCVFSDAIILSHSHIAFLRVRDSCVKGGVVLRSAKIDGNLECIGGEFISKSETSALHANGVEVKGGVFLRNGFKADGGVNLVAARIGNNLECDGGDFISKGKTPALIADGVEVKGSVFLRNGFKADGGVVLRSAKIDGNLECDGGQFISKSETSALHANGVEVKGGVFLRNGFKADGGVNLVAAQIGNNLECDGGQFISKSEASALNASSAKIDGSAYFRGGFAAEGKVVFFAAHVGRGFLWSDVKSPEKSALDLRYSKVGTLLNSQNSWPAKGSLLVDGFVYDQFDDRALPEAKVQVGWLQRQPQLRLLPQPFEQLAAVLRKMGLEEDARIVMIAKNEEHASYLHWRSEWIWYGLLGKLIGYGYRPWRAFVISMVVIGIGWLFFLGGYRHGLITPTEEKAYVLLKDGKRDMSEIYPKFNAFVYSLESFVPLVKLGISDRWTPNANRGGSLRLGIVSFPRTGSLLRYYLPHHRWLGSYDSLGGRHNWVSKNLITRTREVARGGVDCFRLRRPPKFPSKSSHYNCCTRQSRVCFESSNMHVKWNDS